VKADSLHDHGTGLWPLLGLGTFLGVVLHKWLDSMSITSLMVASGWSVRWIRIINIIYALMCPLGAAAFYFGVQLWSGSQAEFIAAALAASAGVFLSIALSDLLPEIQFHSHDRLRLSAALLVGVIAAWAIGLAEPAHTHGGHPPSAPIAEPHEHDHNPHHH
jgi:zinc and cadmium transporter